jgi:AmmeMemoRadiSam system protein B/AmmeMemoRadiSam system protein A
MGAVTHGAVRPPSVAGAFYTDDVEALRLQVEGFLDRAGTPTGPIRAAVAPHAGYSYSGAVAAKSLKAIGLRPPRRVILLGPSHYVGFEGGALPSEEITAFATPLGNVTIDRAAVTRLRRDPDFGGPTQAHDREHSLEVELPFLQTVAPDARIVPILVGANTDREACRRMARALTSLIDDDTVVVVSSDFTHHGARYGYAPFDGDRLLGEELLELGRQTADRLAALDADGFWYQVEVSGDTVCGRRPLEVLMELLGHAFTGSGSVVEVTTSGEVTGSYDLSVTYASVVFSGAWKPWEAQQQPPGLGDLDAAQGATMLSLARASLHTHLAHDGALAEWFSKHGGDRRLDALAGAFVTVHNTGRRALQEGRLRACMGVIEAAQPAVDAVVSAAVSAAHDPRFPPLKLDELDEVALEVSLLSPSERVPGPQAIRVGVHGVVLSKGRHRAVFLPQVAPEQGWDRDEMLDHLAVKAGLPADGWRRGAEFEVFTAQVFSEDS